MKIFLTSQVRSLDQYSIVHSPITSIDLMENAADALFHKYVSLFSSRRPVIIFAGPGNNGGDALALARMLLHAQYHVKVFLLHSGKLSADCAENFQRLRMHFPECYREQTADFCAPVPEVDTVIVDGLFGSGLSRTLSGIYARAVEWINCQGVEVLSIDIPSGLQGEVLPVKGESPVVVQADYCFSLQFPKLSFFCVEAAPFVGQWEVLDIGIHPQAIADTPTPYTLLDATDAAGLLHSRSRFSHKGTYGHSLVMAGGAGMAGAAVLSAKAALRAGAGLVTVLSEVSNREVLLSTVPELIFRTQLPESGLEPYRAVAVGPGWGCGADALALLQEVMHVGPGVLVCDADALNMLSEHPEFLTQLPPHSILTPHPKEFERLFGPTVDSLDSLRVASAKARELQVIIVLKGAYTRICLPDGRVCLNNSGNAGMATAGSGDVLTGIITGLLSQGYSPADAACLGVYLHGLAGDLALADASQESLIASDIIAFLGKAFTFLRTLSYTK